MISAVSKMLGRSEAFVDIIRLVLKPFRSLETRMTADKRSINYCG
jgi:hypothetical protein